MTIMDFLALDPTDLPSAQILEQLAAEDYDAWDVLCRAADGEGTVLELCGSAIILRADADGWRTPVRVS